MFGKKSLLSISLVTLAVVIVSCASPRLKIKSDTSETLKIGMKTHITRAGAVYPLNESCKSICKDCDGLFSAWQWTTDSITEDYLVLRYDTEFRYDTVSNEEFKARVKADKKLYLDKIISYNKKPVYIYKVPIETEYEMIPYSKMSMLTFSYKKKCYKGGPFQRMFANPNKIRRVNMKDAVLKVKY